MVFQLFFFSSKPLNANKILPWTPICKTATGELVCWRTSSPACSAPPTPSPPQGLLRQTLGNLRALPSSLKTTGLVCPEQVRDPPHPNCLPQTCSEFLVSAYSWRTKWRMQSSTSPINTIKKCSPLSKVKVWAKHLRPVLVPHSCEYNYVATFGDQMKIPRRVNHGLAKLISAQDQGQGSRALCLKSALESSNFSTLGSAAVRSGSGHASGVKLFLSQKKKL